MTRYDLWRRELSKQEFYSTEHLKMSLKDLDVTDSYLVAVVDELIERGETAEVHMGRLMYARMNMVEEYGENFTSEFDKEFEIDYHMPKKQTLRHKLNSFANSLVRSRAAWYVSGIVDGAAILGILNHFFHFLR